MPLVHHILGLSWGRVLAYWKGCVSFQPCFTLRWFHPYMIRNQQRGRQSGINLLTSCKFHWSLCPLRNRCRLRHPPTGPLLSPSYYQQDIKLSRQLHPHGGIQSWSNRVSVWLDLRGMKLNPSKTMSMIVSRSRTARCTTEMPSLIVIVSETHQDLNEYEWECDWVSEVIAHRWPLSDSHFEWNTSAITRH